MAPALVRLLPSSRALTALFVVFIGIVVLASTGFGATSSTQFSSTSVVGTLALTEPTALSAAPDLCSNTLAPLDTDDCTDVSFASGAAPVLRLGSLAGTDVQAGALRWQVTTTNPTGYRVIMQNAGAAPLLRSSNLTIPDMQTAPLVPAASVDDATHFGVAMGNSATDNEAAVDFPGSPWVASGQQGERFSGIPIAGMVIAERGVPQSNDPFTATFAVASIASQQPTPAAYAGSIRITASAL